MECLQAPMSRLETGTYINDRYAAIEDRLAIVRKRLNRPLSFAEKVCRTAVRYLTMEPRCTLACSAQHLRHMP